MKMPTNFSAANWINPPAAFDVGQDFVTIATEPDTDFWQRSYYGFRHDNAPALLLAGEENFNFTMRAAFNYSARFDQCGPIIYLDQDNWFKASVEYENADFSRLGSVVTNQGHSDWATTDIASAAVMWYRLSRRGPDFLIESSADGVAFAQMRIFHLHALGETTAAMGQADPPLPPAQPAPFGLYACSPLDGSFTARFDHFRLEACQWRVHAAE